MWLSVMLVYVVGLALTAATMFRTRVFAQERLMTAGSMLLWPLYWVVFLVALFQNRRR